MSLQVWLPLNGDLHNQGLLQLPNLSANAFAVDNLGKIGKCYGNCGFYHLSEDFLDNTWSLALWVKASSWGQYNDILLCKNIASSDACHFYFSIINGATYNIGINGGSSTVAYSYTFATNTWYHLAATYNGSTIRLYLNGVLVKTGTYTSTKLTGHLNLGIGCRSTNNNGTAVTGSSESRYMNDVRIYDHCLSPKEVEEISKGLVLHYPLNYQNLINKNTLTANSCINSTGTVSSTSNWYASDYIPIASGKTYKTLGLSKGGSGTYIGIYDSSKTKTRTLLLTANENLTINTTSSEKYARLSIRNFDNELENACFYEDITTIYDTSGYSHNGTIVGSLTAAADSPRYGTATIFDGSSAAIKVNDNNWCSQGMSALTINLWAKKASTWPASTRLFSCTETGGFNTEAGNSGYWRFPIHVYTNAEQTSTAYKYDSQEIKTANLSPGEWIMFTFVYDLTGTKTYLNGELHHTYTNTSYGIHFNMNARLFLGCEASTASPASPYFNGQESDFRIYATALTATQIAELYELGRV